MGGPRRSVRKNVGQIFEKPIAFAGAGEAGSSRSVCGVGCAPAQMTPRRMIVARPFCPVGVQALLLSTATSCSLKVLQGAPRVGPPSSAQAVDPRTAGIHGGPSGAAAF